MEKVEGTKFDMADFKQRLGNFIHDAAERLKKRVRIQDYSYCNYLKSCMILPSP